MRKLMARYNVLRENQKFVDITQVRSMAKYMASVREQHGMGMAKAVRLLAAQLMNGFEVVALEKGSAYDVLRALGVMLVIDGRNVKITDSSGSFSFQDDYYYTATKYALLNVSKRYEVPLTLVDHRDRNSVQRIVGDKSDVKLVGFFASGEYLKNRMTKMWGGKDLEKVRQVVFKDDIVRADRGVKIIKTKYVKALNWRRAGTRDEWLDIFDDVLAHNFDKKKTEQLKRYMDRGEFKRTRDRLRRMGAFEIIHPKRVMSEYVYDALFCEVGYDPPLWMSFVVRGCNNLLRYQGDRLEQLSTAYDGVSSISSSNDSMGKVKKK